MNYCRIVFESRECLQKECAACACLDYRVHQLSGEEASWSLVCSHLQGHIKSRKTSCVFILNPPIIYMSNMARNWAHYYTNSETKPCTEVVITWLKLLNHKCVWLQKYEASYSCKLFVILLTYGYMALIHHGQYKRVCDN